MPELFLTERGFDQASWDLFGVGYSPSGWDGLRNELRSKGFTEEEMITAGLAVSGQRGAYDRFRDRVMWPIRDSSGDTIGFGARKLTEADQGPKYLNTPETPIYRKSQVLYGIDLARRDMAKAAASSCRRRLHRRNGLPLSWNHNCSSNVWHCIWSGTRKDASSNSDG
jgi:DNA primase